MSGDESITHWMSRGRGALTNASSRFGAEERALSDDGWNTLGQQEDGEAIIGGQRLTSLGIDTSRRLLSYNKSPDIGFDRSINPYKGCEHGCIYCYARPTHAYLGLSPGLDFETRLFFKPDAPALLRKELSAKTYRPEVIALGANTDPYQPVERKTEITRAIIRVLSDFNHPFGIVTKSDLVVRDIDLLAPMAGKQLVHVAISVTSLDARLARVMEPRAVTPSRRLKAVETLSRAGIPVTVMAAPMIPAVNDHELEQILEAARAAGASQAAYTLLRVPLEIKTLVEEWLEHHFPDRAGRVISLLRQCHGGKAYDATFGTRAKGTGPYADALRARFHTAIKRLGLNRREWPLRTDLFRKPTEETGQLSLGL